MPTLILKTYRAIPAKENHGYPATAFDMDGRAPPFPQESVEIRTSADAVKAFDEYSERVRGSGTPAHIYADIGKRDRAPNGFRKLKLDRYVNV